MADRPSTAREGFHVEVNVGVDGPDGYVYFAVDSQHENYRLVQNIVQAQMSVSEFRLEDYPVRAEDVLHTGQAAFDAALTP